MANDGWASDYLRQLNTQGPGNPGNVVSSKVQYVPPVGRGGQGSDWADTSDIPLAPGQNPEDSVYSNASGARMGQLKPASGYRAPAGGGWDVNSSDTNLRFSNESGGKRYARPKTTQPRSRGSAPVNGVKTRSAPLSGADVTADVMKAVKADGNTSFANWRQSLVNQGWSQAEADAVRYDPSTGKFMSNASGQAATDHYMREQADKDAGIMADNPGVEGKVSGQTPAKTEGGAQPAPAKTEGSAQPAPAKTEGAAQPAPAKPDTQTSVPADDHAQEVKAAVDEFLKQHPADGKELLKSIYGAVDSQNIKDDAAYNLAVLAEIQKASTASDVDNILNNPGNPSEGLPSEKQPSEEFAALQKRGEQTNAGAAEYSDTIRTGLAWAKGALPAGTYNNLATLVNAILTSNDPNRYEQAARALSEMMDESARQQKAFHDAMDGNIVVPDSVRAAEYVRQLRAANAAKAQAAAEAAAQRSDNPEGWL